MKDKIRPSKDERHLQELLRRRKQETLKQVEKMIDEDTFLIEKEMKEQLADDECKFHTLQDYDVLRGKRIALVNLKAQLHGNPEQKELKR